MKEMVISKEFIIKLNKYPIPFVPPVTSAVIPWRVHLCCLVLLFSSFAILFFFFF